MKRYMRYTIYFPLMILANHHGPKQTFSQIPESTLQS